VEKEARQTPDPEKFEAFRRGKGTCEDGKRKQKQKQ